MVVLPTPPLSAPTTITTGFAILVLLEAHNQINDRNIEASGLGRKMAEILDIERLVKALQEGIYAC
jgi:hypothetical protein